MAHRFNPPPGWPVPPTGFHPPAGWRPDPSWPPPPPGWQLWVDDAAPHAAPHAATHAPTQTAPHAAPHQVGGAHPEHAHEGHPGHPPAAANGHADAHAGGHPAGHGEGHAGGHGAATAHGGHNPLLHLLVAISIGLVSVLGAVVVWRAETHAANADAAEQDAISAAITAAHLQSTAEQAADTAQRKFARYQRLGLDAQRLDPGHDCANNTNDNPTTVAEIDARVDCDIQVVFSGYADETSKQGSYDVTRYTTDVLAIDRYFNPNSNPEVAQAQSEQQRAIEHKLLWLSVGLVIVLALLTLSRLGKKTIHTLVLAIPGWGLMLAAVVALIAVEV